MRARIRIIAVVIAAATAAASGCSSAGPAASGSPRAANASVSIPAVADEGPVPSFMPRQYVTLDPADDKRLAVRSTVTGVVAATVTAPHGMVFTAVFGTGTGRVFAVDARPDPPTAGGGDDLFLLRLRSAPGGPPGSVAALPLVRLPAGHGVGPGLTALALSPDGGKIAIGYTYRTYPPHPQPLILYSATTGAVLRTWTVASGIITAADPMANGDLGQDAGGTSMRWTADGRQLGYAFHASSAPGKLGYGYDRDASIRLLDTAKPGSDLIANSRILVSAGYWYNPGNGAGIKCLAASGWSLSADGQAVTCAGQWTFPGGQSAVPAPPAGCGGRPATGNRVYLGFWRQYWLPGGGGGASAVYGPCPASQPAGFQLFWASPDGRIVLGAMGNPGHALFGMLSGGRSFIPLAPPPARPSALAW